MKLLIKRGIYFLSEFTKQVCTVLLQKVRNNNYYNYEIKFYERIIL